MNCNSPIGCSDGNFCNGTEMCNGGTCYVAGGTPGICLGGSIVAPPNGSSCNDSNATTCPDKCSSGACSGPTDTRIGTSCSVGIGACLRTGSWMCTTSGAKCSATAGSPSTEICDNIDNDCDASIDEDYNIGGTCTSGTGACGNTGTYICKTTTSTECNALPKADGTSCSDGNACTLTDGCLSGTCTGSNPKSCTADSNACNGTEQCNPTTGACESVSPPIAGTACSDGSACTSGDICGTTGTCSGTGINCDDGNPCTVDTCDAILGCAHTPATDGTGCDDGNACNGLAFCSAGACQAVPAQDCNDGIACTTDTCNPSSGCIFTPLTAAEIDDNNPCTTDGCHAINGPFHNPINVNDNDACTTDSCDPLSGPQYTPISCSDGNTCTTDSCDPASGCNYPAATNGTTCDDSNPCSQTDTCQSGSCVGTNPLLCSDGNTCTVEACNPATGACESGSISAMNGLSCVDGDLCTPMSFCGDGSCSGTRITCDDNDLCTADACDAVTGFCSNTPVVYNDGDSCTTDSCDPLTGSPLYTPISNDDGIACTIDACVNGSPVNIPDNTDCSDGNACNGIESCNATLGCVEGTPTDIDDGNVCTTDSCDTTTGVITHNALADGTTLPNDGGYCVAGIVVGCLTGQTQACSITNSFGSCSGTKICMNGNWSATCTGQTPSNEICNEVDDDCDGKIDEDFNIGQTCTDGIDQCHTGVWQCSAGGQICAASNQADGTACNDSSACTSNDVCTAGVCGGVAIPKPADTACQTSGSACNPITGQYDLINKADGTVCSDGTACTQTDTCVAGACAGSNPVTCNASDQCHDAGVCDPLTGACSNPDKAPGSACSDGNACTGPNSEGCQSGLCIPGIAVTCADDGNVCTSQSCDPAVGCVSTNTDQTGIACSTGMSGQCAAGTQNCVSGTLSACAPSATRAEICNGMDDDCDGAVDEDFLNLGDSCTAGVGACSNTGIIICQDDGTAAGCDVSAKPDGTSCSDSNACTPLDICQAGVCTGTGQVNCDDKNSCTDDSCDILAGCLSVNNAAVCNDNNACTENDICGTGACGGSPVDIDDTIACTVDACDAVLGVTHTLDNAQCNDNNDCTADLCDASADCQFTQLPDGQGITGGVCRNGNICVPGLEICNGLDDDCDGEIDEGGNALCNDNSACTNDVCGGSAECQNSPISSDDANACTDDTCDATAGVQHATVSCDDANACNGIESCNAQTGCVVGTALSCDDANACNGIESCSPSLGCEAGTALSCDDANACNGVETCDAASGCVAGAAPVVDDANACTDDTCDQTSGPAHTLLAGVGNACTTSVNDCDQNGVNRCDTTSGDVSCFVENPVSKNACGVCGQPDPINLGLECGAGEGACRSLGHYICDPANPSGSVVCDAQALNISCDDGDKCTAPDTCNNGTCNAGANISCEDDNTCTLDSCDPATGCLNVNNDAYVETCYEGPAGTQGVGICKGGEKKCSDNILSAICTGQVVPTAETCNNNIDEDCNGTADNGCCGNGQKEGVEVCDDGNLVAGDGCSSACTNEPRCGDSLVNQVGEECDDGNTNNLDACANNCKNAGCGDGLVQAGETCDQAAANGSAPGACNLTCNGTLPECGNSITEGNEQCDDGNTNNNDACISGCLNARCGDTFTQPGETCDEGAMNGVPGHCNNTCGGTIALCGNNNIEQGEGCEVGITVLGNNERCENCQIVIQPIVATCGDGTREGSEQCDDGNTVSGDGCSDTCTTEIAQRQPVCGDGTKEGSEQCDDNNTVSGDGCSDTCTTEVAQRQPVCGDGTKEGSEECDDSNTISGDGCSDTCTTEVTVPKETELPTAEAKSNIFDLDRTCSIAISQQMLDVYGATTLFPNDYEKQMLVFSGDDGTGEAALGYVASKEMTPACDFGVKYCSLNSDPWKKLVATLFSGENQNTLIGAVANKYYYINNFEQSAKAQPNDCALEPTVLAADIRRTIAVAGPINPEEDLLRQPECEIKRIHDLKAEGHRVIGAVECDLTNPASGKLIGFDSFIYDPAKKQFNQSFKVLNPDDHLEEGGEVLSMKADIKSDSRVVIITSLKRKEVPAKVQTLLYDCSQTGIHWNCQNPQILPDSPMAMVDTDEIQKVQERSRRHSDEAVEHNEGESSESLWITEEAKVVEVKEAEAAANPEVVANRALAPDGPDATQRSYTTTENGTVTQGDGSPLKPSWAMSAWYQPDAWNIVVAQKDQPALQVLRLTVGEDGKNHMDPLPTEIYTADSKLNNIHNNDQIIYTNPFDPIRILRKTFGGADLAAFFEMIDTASGAKVGTVLTVFYNINEAPEASITDANFNGKNGTVYWKSFDGMKDALTSTAHLKDKNGINLDHWLDTISLEKVEFTNRGLPSNKEGSVNLPPPENAAGKSGAGKSADVSVSKDSVSLNDVVWPLEGSVCGTDAGN
ncbi:MAG: DUF4215 domain-containing protein, partial [Deltaproteobacteria bacterium]|nr:DUF4215 domain-containing protein [Deltaproteobacteria bacterium]